MKCGKIKDFFNPVLNPSSLRVVGFIPIKFDFIEQWLDSISKTLPTNLDFGMVKQAWQMWFSGILIKVLP